MNDDVCMYLYMWDCVYWFVPVYLGVCLSVYVLKICLKCESVCMCVYIVEICIYVYTSVCECVYVWVFVRLYEYICI